MTDMLKLNVHFAERERSGRRFLAEALLDLFARQNIATSLMLRGIASFGPRNIVRTDESLSLSEDLPVLISALDAPAAIEAVVDDAVALTNRGLVTLERAQTACGPFTGNQNVKLTVYLGRQHRAERRPGYEVACEVVHRLGFSSATTFLGVDGTVDGQRRRARFFSRNVEVPLMVTAIGTAAQADAATSELAERLDDPLVTTERAQLCKRDGRLLEAPEGTGTFPCRKLTVLTTEDNLHHGVPVHRALVHRLREEHDVSGATVFRGLWGFQGGQPPHGDSIFRVGRRVPVATVVVGTPEVITRAFALADELTTVHGLVTCERVPAMLAIDGTPRHGDTRLDRG